jgi:hypothetical protein
VKKPFVAALVSLSFKFFHTVKTVCQRQEIVPFLKNLRFYSDFIKETLACCLSHLRATVPPVQITSEKTFFASALERILSGNAFMQIF